MGLKTKDEYIESLRALKPTAYMFGERLDNIVDNPRLRAGIEATGATYEIAGIDEYKQYVVTQSPLINEPVNRFTLPPSSIEDLVARVKVNRKLGNFVGTCHQRCTGLDCLSTLAIVTYDIDQKYGTEYNARFTEFLKYVQKNDLTANAGVTDVKGDRSLGPTDQPDKDMYLHVVEKREGRDRGARRQGPPDGIPFVPRDHRPADAGHGQGGQGLRRRLRRPGRHEGPDPRRRQIDPRHAGDRTAATSAIRCYSKYCPTLIFDDVFVPWERVFMCGETEFAADMVVKFSSLHRQSHGGCKSGKIDCMIGAALTLMDYNGTAKVSHHKQKVIDMIHRAETLYACCLAASYEGQKQPSGNLLHRHGPRQRLEDPRGQGDGRGDPADDRHLRRLRGGPAFRQGFREPRGRRRS